MDVLQKNDQILAFLKVNPELERMRIKIIKTMTKVGVKTLISNVIFFIIFMLQALKQPPKQKDSSYFFRYLSRMSNCETFVRSTRVSLLWDSAVIKNLNHTACIDKYYWRSLIKFIWSPNVFGEVFWVSMYNAQKLSATQICWCYQRFMISDNAIFWFLPKSWK